MKPEQPSKKASLGLRIKVLRLERDLSLASLSSKISVSEATLSRIENGLSDISAHKLYSLATALDVEIIEFFNDVFSSAHDGLGVVTRKDQTSDFQSRSFTSQLLSANLPGKQMHPFRNTVSASSLEEVGGLHAHPGEEFLFVLSGKIFLHTEQNTPLLLETGDCIYFYASHAHAYVNGQNDPSEFLVVTTQPPTSKDIKL